jgi:hypothetical protein
MSRNKGFFRDALRRYHPVTLDASQRPHRAPVASKRKGHQNGVAHREPKVEKQTHLMLEIAGLLRFFGS